MGKTRAERILRAVEGEIWAIQPEKLQTIAEVLTAKAETGHIPSASDIEAAEAAQRGRMKSMPSSSGSSIAVIPVFGTISRRMGMLDAMSGGTSIEGLQESLRQALADDQVGSILLQIHSPGGSVYGVEEAARMIMDGRKKKRIVAIADQLMASAAYYLGSAASELVVTPSGEAGSIGVYTVHFDWSKAIEAEGVKVTIVKAGQRKAEGNPYEPLDDEAAAHLQSIVDAYYGQFVRSVAKGRGISLQKVQAEFGQGLTYDSARLVERGMVDRIATLDETIEDLRKGSGQLGSRSRVAVAADLGSLEPAASQTIEFGPGAVNISVPPFADLDHIATAFLDDLRRAAGRIAPTDSSTSAPRAETPTDTPTSESDAAGGHAAHDIPDAPTEPAEQAREEPVDSKDTAAQPSGAGTQDQNAVNAAIAAERERTRQIRAIGEAHTIEASKVDQWIAGGLSIDAVNAAALQIIQGRRSASPDVQVGADREAERPFATLGHQLQAVALAEKNPSATDKRLLRLNEDFSRAAAASGSNTTVPGDGGFVVQAEFMPGITSKMWDEGRVLSRTNRIPIGENSNRLTRNHLKEHSRKTGSRYGGVRVYRTAEAKTVETSHPDVREQTINLDKLMGIYYATEETMQDAVALTVEAEKGFRSEMTFVAENEIFRGTGAGQCLGFLNSNALVTVLKESSQAADTLLVKNVSKMMARLPSRSFPTAAWFIHSTVIPELVSLQIGDTPVFIPGGNIAGGRFGTLFGLPIEPVEYCAPVGDLGDIVLADLDQYTTIDKGGDQWTQSIHVRFLQDETAFKLTYRFNGQPDWDEAITEFQGTLKQSPFIVLEART